MPTATAIGVTASARGLVSGTGRRWPCQQGISAGEYGEYLNLLGQCEVALSTALHDFQGLALMQACGAGCSPLAPARLVYPEWLDEAFLYPGDAADPQREAAGAVAMILALAEKRASGESLPLADVSRFSSDVLLDEYRRVLSAVTLLAMT